MTDQLWAYASAVMLGMTEKAAESGDARAAEMMKDIDDYEHDDDNIEYIDSDVIDDVITQTTNETNSMHNEL